MKIRLGIIATLVATASLAGSAPSWDEFWHSVKVDPVPPANFIDVPAFRGKVLNLTTGRLSDDVVRQWIQADLRRGVADTWAAKNLRRDIAEAGIFGPPGLNGTSDAIDSERAKYTVRTEGPDSEIVAAAVIWLSPEDRRVYARLGFTEYVIVLAFRIPTGQRFRVFGSGAREPIPSSLKPGELHWQLDTGHFFTHPVLGPLWYQQTGFTCIPDDGTRVGEICARVKP